MSQISIRPIRHDDLKFVTAMLHAAAFWRGGEAPPIDAVMDQPELALYLDGWGRHGDQGLVALLDVVPVGAVWIRHFSGELHAYGYVDPLTPELSIAVAEGHRGHGVGRALLTAMFAQARLGDIARISLSVETDNPALALYEQVGFRAVDAVGGAVTMVREDQDRSAK
jgi:ribosomal protein S18 acetylase RimI-like enzyme